MSTGQASAVACLASGASRAFVAAVVFRVVSCLLRCRTRPSSITDVAVVCMRARRNSLKYTQDHAKWGVSIGSSYSCIGDINRMQSQEGRGGGTMCFSYSKLHTALTDAITSTDACSTGPPNATTAVQ